VVSVKFEISSSRMDRLYQSVDFAIRDLLESTENPLALSSYLWAFRANRLTSINGDRLTRWGINWARHVLVDGSVSRRKDDDYASAGLAIASLSGTEELSANRLELGPALKGILSDEFQRRTIPFRRASYGAIILLAAKTLDIEDTRIQTSAIRITHEFKTAMQSGRLFGVAYDAQLALSTVGDELRSEFEHAALSRLHSSSTAYDDQIYLLQALWQLDPRTIDQQEFMVLSQELITKAPAWKYLMNGTEDVAPAGDGKVTLALSHLHRAALLDVASRHLAAITVMKGQDRLASSIERTHAEPSQFDSEREVFADALARLQRDIKTNGSVRDVEPLLGSEDILNLNVVSDKPGRDVLYDHVVFERKFYLSDKLLAAFRGWWGQNQTALLEREQMCRLFFLHEFFHIRQHVDSNTYRYSVEADETFRFIDYDADAFAVKLSLALGDGVAGWIKNFPLILAAHIKCGDAFRFAEDGRVANTIDGARLQRQLLWHLQYARSKSFKSEAAFEDFEIEKHLIVDLYKFNPQREMENLCRRESVQSSDLSAPIELNLVWGERRIRHSFSLPYYTNKLVEGVFNANLLDSAEAFRPLFDEHPHLIGRSQ